MSSDEISLNGLNAPLVFQDDAFRSLNCQQHRVGDPGPKTRELTGFIDDKMFTVDRDRYFRPQPTIYAEHPDRRDPQQPRDWNSNATSPSSEESDGEDDDVDDDEEDDDVDETDKNINHNNNSNSTNCNNNNNSSNCSLIAAAVEKIGNGKAKNQPSFGKNCVNHSSLRNCGNFVVFFIYFNFLYLYYCY